MKLVRSLVASADGFTVWVPAVCGLALALALTGGCGDSQEPCEGPNGPCIVIEPGAGVQERAQTALIEARPGDVILFEAGIHRFTRGLSLDVDNVTVRGRGMERTTLSFRGQADGAEGLLVTADEVLVEALAIVDPEGDGLKFEGASGVWIRGVRVEWSAGANAGNGGYGLYPVRCTDVLIEDSVAIGASDAGIYVGQSENVIVRRNRVEYNVAGIEIENTSGADLLDNLATHNAGGVLVFNVPGLQIGRGERTRVVGNRIVDNNTANFASPGNIVGRVARGTGLMLLAAHNVEISNNQLQDNDTMNLGVFSAHAIELEFQDPSYDAYSDTVFVHDNVFSGGGAAPADALGMMILQGLSSALAEPIVVPDIVIDGWSNPDLEVDGQLPASKKICIQRNGDAEFVDLDRANDFAALSLDLSPHDCAHAALPAVSLPRGE